MCTAVNTNKELLAIAGVLFIENEGQKVLNTIKEEIVINYCKKI